MKKSRHTPLCLLYLFFNLIGCHLFSVAYTNNEEITVARQMPSFAEAGETITVETTITIGGITNPINGFYFTDQIPEDLKTSLLEESLEMRKSDVKWAGGDSNS